MMSLGIDHHGSSGVQTLTAAQTGTYVPRSSYDQRPAPSGALGRYLVLDVLGRGGMGLVLRAYDPALEREVALKVLTRDRLEDGAQMRLVREARAMAQMSHENVVAVYDVEKSREDMVIVMELIRGRTLRAWLEHARPTRGEIIERFVQAGRGLAAAHDVGILHRDFKPSNVLIPYRGPVKVTDFGLAKAAVPPRTTPGLGSSAGGILTTLTRDGTVMGTPRYMAPEQHLGKALTPAVDQYALCLALWEALLGSSPFDTDGYEPMVLCKLSDPVSWPAGSSVPRRIARAICRGLAIDPAQRWPSMRALLDALAPAPVRRPRPRVASVGALVFVALGGIAAAAGTTLRPCAEAQEQLSGVWDEDVRAEVHAAMLGTGLSFAPSVVSHVEPALDRYTEGWVDAVVDTCEATQVRGEYSVEVMDRRMACLQRARQQLRAVTRVLASADGEVLTRAHRMVGQLEPVEGCIDVEAQVAEVAPPPPGEAEPVGRARAALASAHAQIEAGRYREAELSVTAAQAELSSVEYGSVRTEVELYRGRVQQFLGHIEAAEAAYESVLEFGARQQQWSLVREAAINLLELVGADQARPQQGLRYYHLAVGLAGDEPEPRAKIAYALGSIRVAQGDLAVAERELRAALTWWNDGSSPAVLHAARVRGSLSNVLMQQGRYAESEAALRDVIASYEAVLGPEHPTLAAMRGNLGIILKVAGSYDEASVELRRAFESLDELYAPDDTRLVTIRDNLAGVLAKQGAYDEAEAELRRVLALRRHKLGDEHPLMFMSWINLANTLGRAGRHPEAEAEYRRIIDAQHGALPGDHPFVGSARYNLAQCLLRQDRAAEAEPEFREALAAQQAAYAAEHPALATTRSALASTLLALGRDAEALALARSAWARLGEDDTVDPGTRARTAFNLARALWNDPHRRDRARSMAERSLALLEPIADGQVTPIDDVRRWLQTHQ